MIAIRTLFAMKAPQGINCRCSWYFLYITTAVTTRNRGRAPVARGKQVGTRTFLPQRATNFMLVASGSTIRFMSGWLAIRATLLVGRFVDDPPQRAYSTPPE